jgi:hypothetical protein
MARLAREQGYRDGRSAPSGTTVTLSLCTTSGIMTSAATLGHVAFGYPSLTARHWCSVRSDAVG